ncbi:hypothetical protein PR048_003416, partial [Dryococelus australis]
MHFAFTLHWVVVIRFLMKNNSQLGVELQTNRFCFEKEISWTTSDGNMTGKCGCCENFVWNSAQRSKNVLLQNYDCTRTDRKRFRNCATLYLHFLQNRWFSSCLSGDVCFHLSDMENVWFQQDDAPPHISCHFLGILREMFPGHVVAMQGYIRWSPLLLDLTQISKIPGVPTPSPHIGRSEVGNNPQNCCHSTLNNLQGNGKLLRKTQSVYQQWRLPLD